MCIDRERQDGSEVTTATFDDVPQTCHSSVSDRRWRERESARARERESESERERERERSFIDGDTAPGRTGSSIDGEYSNPHSPFGHVARLGGWVNTRGLSIVFNDNSRATASSCTNPLSNVSAPPPSTPPTFSSAPLPHHPSVHHPLPPLNHQNSNSGTHYSRVPPGPLASALILVHWQVFVHYCRTYYKAVRVWGGGYSSTRGGGLLEQ